MTRSANEKEKSIAELLSEPGENWVKKLYAECLLIAAIKQDVFIHLVETMIQEEKFYKAQERADERAALARTEMLQELIDANTAPGAPRPNAANPASVPLPMVKIILQKEKEKLLSVDQSKLSAPELAAHHRQLSINLSNQLSAQLGTAVMSPDGVERRVIALDDGTQLNVPQLSSRGAASINEMLSHNPALADEIMQDQNMQNTFSTVFTKRENFLGVIGKVQEILDENGIELDLGSRKKLFTLVDSTIKLVNEDNLDLAEKLVQNSDISLKLFGQHYRQTLSLSLAASASVSQPPAMFGESAEQK